jgi:4-hydroxy-3-methylbut-2-enyl diphosphate reductase
MKQFEIPEFYRSPIISQVKTKRKLNDPRKKDFSPSVLNFGKIKFIIARHFGFCYGVENAIEIAYKAIAENQGKRIYLLSQMIHNPDVNADLLANGVSFIQDTMGNQLIEWEEINSDDLVVIPAFGTTIQIENKLKSLGVSIEKYNTTCPFVEKVWNRSQKLGETNHTIIIHGKYNHEETRATFSHSSLNAPSIIIKDMSEAIFLGEVITKKRGAEDFEKFFKGKFTEGFDILKDLRKIGVVNQTTMLASETQEITDYLREVMKQEWGEENLRNHMADTRDTLCYATNDNQTSTLELMEQNADLAIVIGGYNSSNTTHLVELLERKFPTLFIQSKEEIEPDGNINSYNIHSLKKERIINPLNMLSDDELKIIITSGASCPDSIVDNVIQEILKLKQVTVTVDQALNEFLVD